MRRAQARSPPQYAALRSSRSGRMDPEAVAPQDRIADHGGREVTELQTEHERPRKGNPAPSAIDATLDDLGSGVAAQQKWGRPVEAIGHRRIEKPGTYDGHAYAALLQARPQRFRVGAQPGLARAIARVIGKPAIGGNRRDDGDATASA